MASDSHPLRATQVVFIDTELQKASHMFLVLLQGSVDVYGTTQRFQEHKTYIKQNELQSKTSITESLRIGSHLKASPSEQTHSATKHKRTKPDISADTRPSYYVTPERDLDPYACLPTYLPHLSTVYTTGPAGRSVTLVLDHIS